MSKTLIITLAITLIIGFVLGWQIKPEKDCPKPVTKVDTTYIYIEKTDTLIKPKFYVRVDTVIIKQLDTTIIKNKHIAEVDTLYEDLNLRANIKFISDIPLSTNSYFDLKFKLKQKEVIKTITIEKEPNFWTNRFVTYIGVGLSYSVNSTTIEPSIQLGVGVRLGK